MGHAFKHRMAAFGDLLKRYRTVFSHVWQERDLLDIKKYKPEEAEFLPAALSLQETPVSPAPRVAMWLLIGFAFVSVLWSVFGRIDIVATAHGKIIPGSRTKTIQSLEAASIKKIFVTDGQLVKAGEVLIELDATSAEADVDRVKGDRASYQLQAARARAMLDALRTGKLGKLEATPAAEAPQVDQALRHLEGQYAEFRAKLSYLETEIIKREAELQSTRALVRKLEQTAPLARQRAEDYKQLVESNYVSQHGYLEREQQRIEQEADLANLQSRTREITASLREVENQKKSLAAETSRIALDSLNEAQQKLASLKQEHIKADSRAQLMRLTSPVDGVVQQLVVHTVGGVVTPAQALMMIVPQENALEVEAILENKDIGFVTAGQSAAVKIETFEYTKYGIVPATVTQVSNDAINDEKRGLIYSMRVRMNRSTIQVADKTVNLAPGMAVTVEVKTGTRRVIEYFLSPLLQYANESLGER